MQELNDYVPIELHETYMTDIIVHNVFSLARVREQSSLWAMKSCIIALSKQLKIVTDAYINAKSQCELIDIMETFNAAKE